MIQQEVRKESKKHIKLVALVGLIMAVTMMLAACGGEPKQKSETESSNHSAVMGEYDVITGDPKAIADGNVGMTSGEEATEEEATQQDRVSGGANSGSAQSENVDPLDIITLSTKEPGELTIGLANDPAQVLHETKGRDNCLSCHEADGEGTQMPSSHIQAEIPNDYCLECHTPR